MTIAVPLVLSTGAMSVQEFVDRIFLAWYSAEAIAAAAPAGMLFLTVTSVFCGTAGYTNVFVAQYYGAGRPGRVGPAVWQGIYVALGGGLIILCLIPLAPLFFDLVGHPPEVRRLETLYFQILCRGGFPVTALTAMAGFYAGRGRTWAVLWVHCLNTIINVILDYALVLGNWGLPRMGIEGAGWATVMAATVSCLVFMIMMSSKKADQTYRTISGRGWDRELFFRLLRFGFPAGIQFLLDVAAWTIFVLFVGRLDLISLAATNIALNINLLAFMPMIGAGTAISVLVGQYLGRNRPDLAEKSVYSGFHLTFAFMATVSAGFILIPELFIAPFALRADPMEFVEIHKLTVLLLKIAAAFCIFDTMNLMFASAIKGAGDTRFLMKVLLIASSCVLFAPTYLAVVVLRLNVLAPWFIILAFIGVLACVFYLRFLGGKWKSMRVVESSVPASADAVYSR